MFQKLVSRNDDLRRLVEKGYAVAFDSNCLVVRDIPYLNAQGELETGAIVSKLEFIDKERVQQVDHQVFFAGGHPHELDGRSIGNLGGGLTTLSLTENCKDVVVERSFSNKPRQTGRYDNLFHKIETYVSIISGPAIAKFDDRANPLTFRSVATAEPDPIFKFQDTMTSRAEIADIAAKFRNDVIAIIGLGGTGSYVLDFLAKTPVKEIRGFDHDRYYVHNSFRSPGRLDEGELGKKKAEVYAARYDGFRTGLRILPTFVDASSADELNGVTFAFVCVDKGGSRAGIFDVLMAKGIPFIDAGMGLNRKLGPLNGLVRMTYYPANNAQKIRDKQLASLADASEDLYRVAIQIGELNALNACLAVVRFKQIRGFYAEELSLYHLLFGIGDLKITGESDV